MSARACLKASVSTSLPQCLRMPVEEYGLWYDQVDLVRLRPMIDFENLGRNLAGNYRYISWSHRWAKPRLKREDRIIARFLAKHENLYRGGRPWASLDLGCGSHPANPFGAETVCGIDIRDDVENNVLKADLTFDPIPCETSSLDFVTAHDFIEHVPRVIALGSGSRFPFVELMSEIYRVLKPGGFFFPALLLIPTMKYFRIQPTSILLRAIHFLIIFVGMVLVGHGQESMVFKAVSSLLASVGVVRGSSPSCKKCLRSP